MKQIASLAKFAVIGVFPFLLALYFCSTPFADCRDFAEETTLCQRSSRCARCWVLEDPSECELENYREEVVDHRYDQKLNRCAEVDRDVEASWPTKQRTWIGEYMEYRRINGNGQGV